MNIYCTRSISGIYKIICKNNKFYIGSSTNIDKRLKQHIGLLNKNKHYNSRLQKAWNEYGEHNFRYEIIETINNIKQLSIREKLWIDNTNCCNKRIGFNISNCPHIPYTGRFIDLKGQRFNKLIVLEYVGKNKSGISRWRCKCDCGEEAIVNSDRLKNNNTKSCGCLRKGNVNGLKHGMYRSHTYIIWSHMRQRCNNPKDLAYKNYGDRGITVCNRWLRPKGKGFMNFLEDMGEIPKGYELDRIDNNQLKNGYSPENCKLSTRKEQMRNTRMNINIPYNGKYICLKDYCKIKNLNYNTILSRIRCGKSLKMALNRPIRKHVKRK